MRLTYCQIEGGNFGDDLNPWLWPRIAPGVLDDDSSEEFLGIGTILSNSSRSHARRVVFGSGAGYKRPPVVDNRWKIYCVRGPRTAAKLKIDRSLAITDAAALVANVPMPACDQQVKVSYMPHHHSAELGDWQSVCERAGMQYIPPNGNVATTIDQIRQSKLLITEALHGAVVADALRIPWIAVRAYGHILPFKWHDWCESLELNYDPCVLPSLRQQPLSVSQRMVSLARRAFGYLPGGKEKWRWSPLFVHGEARIDRLAKELNSVAVNANVQLSKDVIHRRVLERLTQKLETLQRDYSTPVVAA